MVGRDAAANKPQTRKIARFTRPLPSHDRSKRRSERRRGQLHSKPIGNRLNAINVIKPIFHPRFFFHPTPAGRLFLIDERGFCIDCLGGTRPDIGEPAGSTFLRPREKDSADDTKRGRIIKLSVGWRLSSLSLSFLVLLVSGDRLIEIVRILVIKKYPGQGGG